MYLSLFYLYHVDQKLNEKQKKNNHNNEENGTKFIEKTNDVENSQIRKKMEKENRCKQKNEINKMFLLYRSDDKNFIFHHNINNEEDNLLRNLFIVT